MVYRWIPCKHTLGMNFILATYGREVDTWTPLNIKRCKNLNLSDIDFPSSFSGENPSQSIQNLISCNFPGTNTQAFDWKRTILDLFVGQFECIFLNYRDPTFLYGSKRRRGKQ
jgi:hypothetical protein